jgi:two-component system LytT family response regulator
MEKNSTPAEIRCLIVDDEPLARESLRQALGQCSDVNVVGECANGFEAVKAVAEKEPDLLFLDIQMPKLNGFDVVELLGDDAPLVVFVTAYDEYALQAFAAQALDYLMKPVRAERLQQALARAREQLALRRRQPLSGLVRDHQRQDAPLARILIRDRDEVHIVPVTEVMFFEAQDDYVNIVTARREYLKQERLNRLEEMLDSRRFCRIHRSYLLNLDYLQKIEPYSRDSRLAVLKKSERTLPVSRSGYQRLMELLQ